MGETFSLKAYETMLEELFRRCPSFGSNGSAAYKPGLEREVEFCHLLGDPQKNLKCIHVAGTNGKGSTCNMLSAHFASKGLRVGLYTSPHILDFRERMRIVGKEEDMPGESIRRTSSGQATRARLISREEVWEFLSRWGGTADSMELSLFEITTAMAFDFFARSKVDLAVIETGLGGRLDATNIITPELSVITNIGYDHMNLLGNTLEEIAGEKAGIIKTGVPVVIGESGEQTDEVFLSAARRLGSPIVFAGKAAGGPIADSTGADILGKMDLRGIYQEKNLRTVCCALEVLGETPRLEAIENAARICDFHGRWEKISDSPVTICDIGHNAHGLRYNFKQLNDMLDSGKYSDLVMVYGSVSDKDVDAVLRLLPRRSHIFFTAASTPRAMKAEELMARAIATRETDAKNPDLRPNDAWKAVPTVAEAVKQAEELCAALPRPLLYIGGSTYVVSEALKEQRMP